ncbi:MAG: serine/threonine-protein phosphatase [Nocardioidaceae bacterium]|nr:serine/threonine-protein phosphatase [Nocardioidaceae bacterium]
MTHDHTWVQNLIDEGRITEDEAKTHAHRSLILKVLDGRHDNAPDLTIYELEEGDRILLCSDGLSGFVDHDRMQRVLGIGTAQSVAEELTQLALEAGSTDNITVVVADVVADTADEPAMDAPLVVGAAADEPRRPLSRLRSWAHGDDTAVGESLLDPDVDPEELRYALREPRRFLWLRRGLILVVGVALIAALGFYAYRWTQRQYYVAAANGQVAIYQGVQPDLPGLSLHQVYETQDLKLSELPSFRRTQVVEGLNAGDIQDAERIVEMLQSFAAGCAAQATANPDPTTTAPSATVRSGRQTETQSASDSASPGTLTGRGSRSEETKQPAPTATAGTVREPTSRTIRPTESSPAARSESVTPATTSDPADPADLTPEECSGATPLPEATR